MTKIVKKVFIAFLRGISGLIVLITMIIIVLSVILQSEIFQNIIADKVTKVLSEKCETKFDIGNIKISFFDRIRLENVYIEDYHGDTMIFANKVDVAIKGINLLDKYIALGKVQLKEGKLHIFKGSDGESNLKKVFSHLKKKEPSEFSINLSAKNLNLEDFTFSLKDSIAGDTPNKINFKDLLIHDASVDLENINIEEDKISCSVNNISVKEKCGLDLQNLESKKISYSSHGLEIEDLNFLLSKSYISLKKVDIHYDSLPAIKDMTFDIAIGKGTLLSMTTLDYFIKQKKSLTSKISFSGELTGSIPHFFSHLSLSSNGNELEFKSDVNGLPDINSASFDLELINLKSNYKSIRAIAKDITKKTLNNNITDIISRLGTISMNGKFNGKIKDFDANAKILTSLGNFDFEGEVHPTDSSIDIRSLIKTGGFNLGKTFNIKKVGKVALSAETKAQLSSRNGIIANGTFKLDSLYYGSYIFHDIIANGRLERKKFTGRIFSENDSNLNFNAIGIYDFSIDSLPEYNFSMKLNNADLVALGLNKRDSVSKVKATFASNFEGNNLDNITGKMKIDSLYYINHVDTINSGEIVFTANNNDIEKNLKLTSSFVELDFKGKSSYHNIIPYFKQLAKTYVPSFDDINNIVSSYDKKDNENVEEVAVPTYEEGYYSLKITAKENNRFASIFLPGIEFAKNSYINFYFNPKENRFSLKAESDFITKGKTFIDDLSIESHNNSDSLLMNINAYTIDVGKFCFMDAQIHSALHNNHASLKASFNDTSDMADIRLNATLESKEDGKKIIAMQFLPSTIKIDTSVWSIRNKSIIIDRNSIAIDTLRIKSGIQDIIVKGNVGKEIEDTLNIAIRNLDISPATFFIKSAGYNISSVLNGDVAMVSLLKEKIINGILKLKDVDFTGEKFGDCSIASSYDTDQNRLLLNLTIGDGTTPIKGFYGLSDRILDIDVNIPRLRLCLLTPILKGTLINMTGTANTKMNFKLVKGVLPIMNGSAVINSFATTINFTKVRYSVAGSVTVKDNKIMGNNLIVNDMDGNSAILNGYFYSRCFRELEYNIDVNSDRILALNTTKEDNDTFFGKVYANGKFSITGTERKTLLKAEAWTSKGSDFNMPFSSIATNGNENFITFRSSRDNPPLSEKQIKKKQFFNKKTRAKYYAEFEADLTIHVTPDIKANLEYTNSVVSNIIQGSGTGRLDLFINTTTDVFTMNGGFDINNGTYRLIFSIADKTFYLKRGGSIRWNGKPAEPIVDLTGVYQVHTSLQPIMGNSWSSSSSAAIDCGIHLSGLFFSPKITFDITAPNSTPETQIALKNALNTPEALSTQFFYLFLTNSFSSEGTGGNNASNMGSSFVSTTGFEFLSGRISNLLSTQNFSWRPTYKPRTDQNSEELGVETQINLMENRMTLNFEGRYFLNPQYSNRTSPFSGGGNISYNLNKAGNLSLKAFTRVIDRFDETQGLQESGAGVYFTQEFNDWEDLKQRMKQILEKKKEKKKNKRKQR